MNLKDLCEKYRPNKGRDAHSRHFISAYERHFCFRRSMPLSLLEIGVQSGASLRMWADYFPNAAITGVDCNERCMKHATERIKILIGNQADKRFLGTLGMFDIIIDDGGHTMLGQRVSLKRLWKNNLRSGGIYVIEDLETSYWPEFGGGYGRKDTTIARLKEMVDCLNAAAMTHDRAKSYRVSGMRSDVVSMHFYPSICFLHKRP